MRAESIFSREIFFSKWRKSVKTKKFTQQAHRRYFNNATATRLNFTQNVTKSMREKHSKFQLRTMRFVIQRACVRKIYPLAIYVSSHLRNFRASNLQSTTVNLWLSGEGCCSVRFGGLHKFFYRLKLFVLPRSLAQDFASSFRCNAHDAAQSGQKMKLELIDTSCFSKFTFNFPSSISSRSSVFWRFRNCIDSLWIWMAFFSWLTCATGRRDSLVMLLKMKL